MSYPFHMIGHMISPMTETIVIRESGSVEIHEPALKILDYAQRVGVDHRTVREWLRRGLLPGAYKDGSGRWWIPADAVRQDTPVAPRQEPITSGVVEIVAPPEGRSVSAPAFIPLYMSLDDAAPLLGVTAYQIAQHPDEFGVVPWGPNGSLVVPVRRLLGMTS